ncbi:MAG: hypothetical protein SFZ24_09555 [Planctomycetota bacterium]|nr:hypothetical protein [Planctomycetota bacterium]
MLERLTETFISGVELLEAEGRLARHHAAGLVAGLALLVLLLIIAAVGGSLALAGLAMLLAREIGAPGAMIVVGLPASLAAAVTAGLTFRRLRRTLSRPSPPAPSTPTRPPVPLSTNGPAHHAPHSETAHA